MLRHSLLPLVFLAVAAIHGPVMAAGDEQPTAPAKPEDRKICEYFQKTGTRLGRVKVCKTAREWEEERRQLRGTIDSAQTQRSCVQSINC